MNPVSPDQSSRDTGIGMGSHDGSPNSRQQKEAEDYFSCDESDDDDVPFDEMFNQKDDGVKTQPDDDYAEYEQEEQRDTGERGKEMRKKNAEKRMADMKKKAAARESLLNADQSFREKSDAQNLKEKYEAACAQSLRSSREPSDPDFVCHKRTRVRKCLFKKHLF